MSTETNSIHVMSYDKMNKQINREHENIENKLVRRKGINTLINEPGRNNIWLFKIRQQ